PYLPESKREKWSGRKDLNLRPPGPEPGALARLRYAPTICGDTNNPAAGIFRISHHSGISHCAISLSHPASRASSPERDAFASVASTTSGHAARDTLNAMKVFALVCCLLVIGAHITSGQNPEKIPRPNLFLITIDTLRADHVHCYGYERIQTAALDSIARDGIRFGQAFTPSPITNSSHSSILTGLLPSAHGVSDFGVPLSPAHPTLAELLTARGYQTGAFIGAVILDSKRLAPGLDRGFAFYDNFPEHTASKSRWGRLERRAAEVEAHAESWLNQHPDGPHFVWMHFYDPHDPYEPPPPYSETYKDRLYDGEIAYADSSLGHFLAYLKQRGWYD